MGHLGHTNTHLGEEAGIYYKSQTSRRTRRKQCLPGMTWPLHSGTHGAVAAGTGSTQDRTRQCPALSREGLLTEIPLTDSGVTAPRGETMAFLYASSWVEVIRQLWALLSALLGVRVFRWCFAFMSLSLGLFLSSSSNLAHAPTLLLIKVLWGVSHSTDYGRTGFHKSILLFHLFLAFASVNRGFSFTWPHLLSFANNVQFWRFLLR